MAKLYTHAIEIWKNGSYLIPEWDYITTAEWDCPLLFAVPLYGITKNIYLSFGLSNIIFVALWLWTIWKLFSGERVIYSLIIANLILIPYKKGMIEYFNMLFFNGGQYVLKVLVPLMLIAILLQISRKQKWKLTDIIYVGLYLFMLGLTTLSSGLYVFLCGVFPCVLVYFVYYIVKQKKILRWAYLCAGMSLISVAIGYIYNIKWEIGAKSSAMTLCSFPESLPQNIETCFWGIFELFGAVAYDDSTKVMSYNGCNILLRVAFVVAIMFLGGACVIRDKKVLQTEENVNFLKKILLMSIFSMNLFVICLCDGMLLYNGSFQYRYHLIGIIPLMILAGMRMVEIINESNKGKKELVLIAGGLMLVGLIITSERNFMEKERAREELKEICDVAEQMDATKVYFYNNSAAVEMCRLLDQEENAQYINFTAYGEEAYITAYDYYKVEADQQVEFTNSLLVLSGEEQHEEYQILGKEFILLSCKNGYGIYALK